MEKFHELIYAATNRVNAAISRNEPRDGVPGVTEKRVRITSLQEGMRLDQVLRESMPGLGLRGVRRLIVSGTVLVDGRRREKGYRVRPGEELIVLTDEERASTLSELGVRTVFADKEYVVFFKPGGVHTAHQAFGNGMSLEAALSREFTEEFTLLTRLDRATSGLVAAARSRQGAAVFKTWQARGETIKQYLAVVEGKVGSRFCVDAVLETSGGVKVRVAQGSKAPRERRTWGMPLATLTGGRTLLRIVILKGARHQIRAHCAFRGTPVSGDELYGSGGGPEGLLLHHWTLTTPEWTASALPDWPEDVNRTIDSLSLDAVALGAATQQGVDEILTAEGA